MIALQLLLKAELWKKKLYLFNGQIISAKKETLKMKLIKFEKLKY